MGCQKPKRIKGGPSLWTRLFLSGFFARGDMALQTCWSPASARKNLSKKSVLPISLDEFLRACTEAPSNYRATQMLRDFSCKLHCLGTHLGELADEKL